MIPHLPQFTCDHCGRTEEWRCVPSNPNYLVSSCGRVYSTSRRVVRHPCQKNGYSFVYLWQSRIAKWWLVHRIVASAFVEDADMSLQVNHIDGRKWHNCLWNLEMVTPKQNIQHAMKTGLRRSDHMIGERNSQCVLTEETVERIHQLRGKMIQREIARVVNVDYRQVNRILKGHTWRHVYERYQS